MGCNNRFFSEVPRNRDVWGWCCMYCYIVMRFREIYTLLAFG